MNNIDLSRYRRIVQYFWDPEPKNDEDQGGSIWCLGTKYTNRAWSSRIGRSPSDPSVDAGQKTGEESPKSSTANFEENHTGDSLPVKHEIYQEISNHGWPEAFLNDFESRIWITYRSNFPIIPRVEHHNNALTLSVRLRNQITDNCKGFTSDTGWGCMIRSGQSLLANALSILMLGREWRRGSNPELETQLLSLFADHPDARFSIHRFVRHGAEYCQKYPGEWFGPSATAKCIEALSKKLDSPALNVYVTNDTSDVFEDRFIEIASGGSGSIRPTLILLGIRLGIDHVTKVYWDGLKAALKYPQSIGIAGGRPSASHYFLGVQGSYLFYLDPHHTRPALPYPEYPQLYSTEELDSYHTRRIRRLHIKDMDPSMLIGFLIRDNEDWEDFKMRIAATSGKSIINISSEGIQQNQVQEREEALDEVEVLDDEFEEN
ncbi:hypothetical protein ASPZODRAFT_129983 [Penicilliopsis zonata CBS 506.65]|uniref:Cysteine protease n=1 Tax=Penicilliopsis zonata CBS 506.65 TaxID=1073090 RepID=A0A1L9SLP9_9EURO|nr:hypothetical protein ASPZODRAFT_129983 [Penicilliopsis zonata CBS 506.65]OJJ48063.1 hypothetical protein ASPZODRAFT_129983 [Penicilliopsis zonata CBS 506.65]